MIISKLLKTVPPPRVPVNRGSPKLWARVTEKVSLPDWLYDLYHSYGSGYFMLFDADDNVLCYASFMNVFEPPILKRHISDGLGFAENSKPDLVVDFFPRHDDGLFPVIRSYDAIYVLFDPRNEGRVYFTGNFLLGFSRVDCGLVDFLSDTFSGRRDYGFLAPGSTPVAQTRFYRTWKAGYLDAERRRKKRE